MAPCTVPVRLNRELLELRTARNAFVRWAEIDDRIEAVEATFPCLEVVLPAAADVIGIDEIAWLNVALPNRSRAVVMVGRSNCQSYVKS
jgi:hypothetical protein